jgi:hypothetical protein
MRSGLAVPHADRYAGPFYLWTMKLHMGKVPALTESQLCIGLEVVLPLRMNTREEMLERIA